MKGFRARLANPVPGVREVLRVARQGGFRPPKEPDADVPRSPRPHLPALGPGEASLTWIGHATFLVRMGGRAILTDPVWSQRLPGFIPRISAPGLAWEDLPPIDAVLLSHDHYDHLDMPTLRRLPRATPILAGLGTGPLLRRRGFSQVQELDWWQHTDVAGVRFTFVPAHHWGRRGAFDFCRRLWGGWVMEADGRKAWFAGDTGYGPLLRDIGRRCPGIEVAMVPIGAYDPRWFMRPVHVDPGEAVQATLDVGASRMATMHWGTFPLSREPRLEPPRLAAEAWAGAGMPAQDLWTLALGETRAWGPASPQIAGAVAQTQLLPPTR